MLERGTPLFTDFEGVGLDDPIFHQRQEVVFFSLSVDPLFFVCGYSDNGGIFSGQLLPFLDRPHF